MFFSDQITHHK